MRANLCEGNSETSEVGTVRKIPADAYTTLGIQLAAIILYKRAG